MPLSKAQKAKYPADWGEIRARILARSGGRCETCGVHNHLWGYRDVHGAFHESRPEDVPDGRRYFRIVLTIAHTDDPDPANCAESNLASECQRCHLRRDAALHAATRAANRSGRAGQAD